jgi:hypothetical protein
LPRSVSDSDRRLTYISPPTGTTACGKPALSRQTKFGTAQKWSADWGRAEVIDRRPNCRLLTPNGPNSARAAVLACGISQQPTEENMRTLRWHLLADSPEPRCPATPCGSVTDQRGKHEIKPTVRSRSGWAAGAPRRAYLEGGTAPRRPLTNISSRSERFPFSEDRLSPREAARRMIGT